MNIFVLAKNINTSAKYHPDKHIVKMPLETAQLLCTAYIELSKEINLLPTTINFYNKRKRKIVVNLYRSTHKNHPCTLWVKHSLGNFKWTIEHGLALCAEYKFRYNKTHKCETVIKAFKSNLENNPKFCALFNNYNKTKNVQCMPDQYKNTDTVKAYQDYFISEKSHLFNWKNRNTPKFVR
jgi:hypothetical protein